MGNLVGRSLLCLGLSVVIGCGGGGGSSSRKPLPEMLHSGTIAVDETWEASYRHVIVGDVLVEGATPVTLSIEPGTEVAFDGDFTIYVGWNDSGGLRAEGTASKRITFTSNRSTPAKGDWCAIWFCPLAYDYDFNPATGCVMDYCDVEWGGSPSGWGNGSGSILVEGLTAGPSVKISNCRVSNSASVGVLLGEGGMFAAGSTGNRVSGCDSFPIGIEAEEAGTLEAGNYTGNAIDAIELNAYWPVETSATWVDPGVPYHVYYSLYVEGTASPMLTISSGARLEFESQEILYVGWNDSGGITADNVTFTGTMATKGFWVGIVLENWLTSASITNCTVEYGGYDSGYSGYSGDPLGRDDGNILIIENARPNTTINGCTIQHTTGYGIVRGWPVTPTDFSNNTFIDCDLGDQSLPG